MTESGEAVIHIRTPLKIAGWGLRPTGRRFPEDGGGRPNAATVGVRKLSAQFGPGDSSERPEGNVVAGIKRIAVRKPTHRPRHDIGARPIDGENGLRQPAQLAPKPDCRTGPVIQGRSKHVHSLHVIRHALPAPHRRGVKVRPPPGPDGVRRRSGTEDRQWLVKTPEAEEWEGPPSSQRSAARPG